VVHGARRFRRGDAAGLEALRRASAVGRVHPLQDEALRRAVERHGARNWKTIAGLLRNRTDVQCLHRWQKVLRPGLVKGPWTDEVRCVM
jgi:hypothetical protein